MRTRMSPLQLGVAIGLPAGLIMGLLSLLSGITESVGMFAGMLDALFAFVFGAALVGGIAAFIQWRRVVRSLGDVAPPGWYDSPEDDNTQWFWTGTKWTDRTRPTPPRMQTRRF